MGRLSGIDGVVPIHRAGVTERGELFLVMPLYQQSLQDVLTETGAIPWERVVDMLSRVADAITQAHHLGVLHLDLKPSNLLLNDRGEAFVADFGIAELMDSTASLSGTMLTPNYAAPERFIDNTPTQAADVYGLGATMYAALVGAPPFPTEKNTGPAVVMQKVLNEPVDLSKLPDDLPARLRALVDASMAKNPDERPGSAEQFALELSHNDGSTVEGPTADDLTPVERQQPAPSAAAAWRPPPKSPPTLPAPKASPGHNGLAKGPIIGLALAAVVLVGLVAVLLLSRPEQENVANPDNNPTTTETTQSTTTDTSTTTSTTASDADPASIPEAATNRPTSTGELVVGTILPVTGDLAFLGPAEIGGSNLAVEDINAAGGVFGTDVVILQGDSGDLTTDTASLEVDRLLAEGADAIIGAASSAVSLTVIDRITGAGVIQFSPANFSPDFTTYDDNGLYFRTAPSDLLQGRVLANQVLEEGNATASVIFRQESYGTDLADAFMENFEAAGGIIDEFLAYAVDLSLIHISEPTRPY